VSSIWATTVTRASFSRRRSTARAVRGTRRPDSSTPASAPITDAHGFAARSSARTASPLVVTDRPARNGKQLVAHLGRRNGGEWSDADERGFIVLGGGRAEVSCTPDGLQLSVTGEADDLAGLEDVVGRHLVRFGARDELQVRWTRSDGRPGTAQRRESD